MEPALIDSVRQRSGNSVLASPSPLLSAPPPSLESQVTAGDARPLACRKEWLSARSGHAVTELRLDKSPAFAMCSEPLLGLGRFRPVPVRSSCRHGGVVQPGIEG